MDAHREGPGPRTLTVSATQSPVTLDAGQPAFNIDAHRRHKLARLERENTYLRAERQRLEQLLGLALQCATDTPMALLDAICALLGTDPARPRFVEQDETHDRLAQEITQLDHDVQAEHERRRATA